MDRKYFIILDRVSLKCYDTNKSISFSIKITHESQVAQAYEIYIINLIRSQYFTNIQLILILIKMEFHTWILFCPPSFCVTTNGVQIKTQI